MFFFHLPEVYSVNLKITVADYKSNIAPRKFQTVSFYNLDNDYLDKNFTFRGDYSQHITLSSTTVL